MRRHTPSHTRARSRPCRRYRMGSFALRIPECSRCPSSALAAPSAARPGGRSSSPFHPNARDSGGRNPGAYRSRWVLAREPLEILSLVGLEDALLLFGGHAFDPEHLLRIVRVLGFQDALAIPSARVRQLALQLLEVSLAVLEACEHDPASPAPRC